jgi:MarR family transcriptional regulator, 2-MHQ and catechol-resistance regulon repressor
MASVKQPGRQGVKTDAQPPSKKPPFMPLMRELVRCYQAFEQLSGAHIRTMGLTPPQFDVIATLGNTDGMTFKQLGEKTLITKGTLTGVIDRLEEKGLVRRGDHPGDARCFKVVLTKAGEREFQRTFQPHVEYVGRAFAELSQSEIDLMIAKLNSLRTQFEAARHGNEDTNEEAETD